MTEKRRTPPSGAALEALEAIYDAVRSIPAGRVATYGQVAEVAGLPRRARLVGRALRELPEESGVPWHRVVNAGGRISERGGRGSPASKREQRRLLGAEGVAFGRGGRIDLDAWGWDPDQD